MTINHEEISTCKSSCVVIYEGILQTSSQEALTGISNVEKKTQSTFKTMIFAYPKTTSISEFYCRILIHFLNLTFQN